MLGTTIAHYQITAKLGQGGMGEVYRATDTKLGREVAIKVLPESFAQDKERLVRFEREAKTLAILNHPNIASIHGLEQSGNSQALVLELVQGEDLSQRLKRGPLPVDEALDISKQIAEALEAAHEKGIIHRDLKPGNIKVTKEGKVKVLDFGLAKAIVANTSIANSDSPTITADHTLPGTLLGTAGYMSPEQAKGKTVDKRSDIWSFGVVLFECLTGKRLFNGETVTESIGALLNKEPDWDALPDNTPASVRLLLVKCLAKDRKRRLRDIGDACLDLDAKASPLTQTSLPDSTSSSSTQIQSGYRISWTAVCCLLIALASALAGWFLKPAAKEVPPRTIPTDIGLHEDLITTDGNAVQIAPDDSMIAYMAMSNEKGSSLLMVQHMAEGVAKPLPGTENIIDFCISPDSQTICFGTFFAASAKLWTIPVTGGNPTLLDDTETTVPIRGISWMTDDWIVLGNVRTGLHKASVSGGVPEPLTHLGDQEASHRWPQVLPDGKGILFTAAPERSDFENASIKLRMPDGTQKHVLSNAFHGRYLKTGHLVYISRDTLFALRFDPDTCQVKGQPVPILERIASNLKGSAHFGISNQGTMIYKRGSKERQEYTLEWVDREGNREPLLPAKPYGYFELSPDGRYLAYDLWEDHQADIWIYDLEREESRKLVFDPWDNFHPVWSPTSKSIFYISRQDSSITELKWKRIDSGNEGQLIGREHEHILPWAVNQDETGTYCTFTDFEGKEKNISVLPLEGNDETGWSAGDPTTFAPSPEIEVNASTSPDGNWMTYSSKQSNVFEIYVSKYPEGSRTSLISSGGLRSFWPSWSTKGNYLVYESIIKGLASNQTQVFIAKNEKQGNGLLWITPLPWNNAVCFDLTGVKNYALHPNGERLLVRTLATDETAPSDQQDRVILLENFFRHLREKCP